MKKKLLLPGVAIMVTLFIGNISCAQNYETYRKNTWHWEDPAPKPGKTEEIFAHEDAVCFFDRQEVIFGNQNELNMLVCFKRVFRMKLLTDRGVKDKSVLYLPESLDPLYDNHCIPFNNQAISKAQSYFDMELSTFAARVIKKDGRIMDASYTIKMKEEEVFSVNIRMDWTYKYSNSHFWKIDFNNLEPGDELEIAYEVDVPYAVNFYRLNSSRIFIHGNDPKQDYSLRINYKDGADHKLFYNNGSEADTFYIKDGFRNYDWKRKNLYGCMDEDGSQPYRTLPYINYLLHVKSKYVEYNDAVTGDKSYMTYWVFVSRLLLSYEYRTRKNAAVGLHDHQNELVDKFISERTSGIPDTAGLVRFQKIHTLIADSFKFVNDDALFREEDNSNDRMGSFTMSMKIKESSRQRIYAKILNKLNLNYSMMFMSDKRYGQPNPHYVAPVWNQEYLFSIFSDKQMAFIHPKVSDYGWYFDELPFYFENSDGMLLNYNDLYYEFADTPVLLGTPRSSVNDNERMNNIMVNADLDKNVLSFEAKVSLSGQYSTMVRPAYLGFLPDTLNNPLYTKKISDINGKIKPKSINVSLSEKVFPFKFNVRTSYESADLITQSPNGGYDLSLDGWFNYVIYPELSVQNRQLDFYPDFVGQDTYRYMVHFSKPVKIITGPVPVEIKNSLGSFLVKMTQPQPDALLIETQFITASDKVGASGIMDVSAIYQQIEKLNKSSIHFSVLE